MPTSSFFFFPVFFLLACAPHPLSCAPSTGPGRRIFHGPFFPQVSLPPSDPPSLPPHSSPPAPAPSPSTTPAPSPRPKFPFSISSSTPNPSPFFPNYPAPPPPPSPVAFASFPANISSLELPHTPSPKSSSKLVLAAVAAVVCAVLAVAVALFCYCRSKRSRKFPDDKNFSFGNSNHHTSQSLETTSRTHKLRTSSPSSEFLYVGTLVSSRGVTDRTENTPNNAGGGDASGPRKPDSPELRPLPPLSRQSNRSFRQGNEYASSTAGEEEEFYSPRVSLGGRDSESGGGSGSRRAFEAVKAENFRAGSSRSSSSSYSSSTSGSPAQSQSISLSPPVSLSPRRSQPKAPPHVPVLAPPPPPPQKPLIWTAYVVDKANTASSSERDLSDNQDGSPTKSAGSGKYLWSPSLSPAVLSAPPAQDASLRLSTTTGCNGYSPTLSMISSPELSLERTPEKQPQTNSLSPAHFPATLSPDRGLTRYPDQDGSFGTWNPWVHNDPSSSPSSSLLSASPARIEERRNLDTSPRTSNALSSSSPEKSPDHSPARASSNTEHEYLSAPAPAPPPPPPMPWQKFCEAPNPSKPIAQLSSQPPPLMPPSRPFMFQNQTNFYPTQPPQTLEKIEEETPKPKLKTLHWDKVRASSDRETAWDHLRSSSFQLNEEMIESLFIVNTLQSKPKEATPLSISPNQDNQVLDPKKSQNIAIALRAFNVTVDEVCNALSEGNADTLGTELLDSLLKMAPTKEEERKLKDFKDDSPIKLGPAEKFLKAVLDVPFAFKRVEAMLYMTNFQSEIEYLKKSFETLEVACDELRNNRMFLKLLEAVLKTGNRINVGTNRGDAQAFKLDTLLKLVEVKGTDGKTTLLHFVVQEIIRTEGARLSDNSLAPGSTLSEEVKCQILGLQVVSGLSSDLPNVKKAAKMDSEVLSSYICKLSRGIKNIEEVLRLNETIGLGESRQCLSESMNKFMKMAKEEIMRIQAQESIALSLVKEITEYFHGNSANEEAHPFRIFTVVRDFLNVLDHVCKEVGMVNERTIVSSAHKFPVPVTPKS